MRRLVILGAGGYGRTVADIAGQSGAYDEIMFLDDGGISDKVSGKYADYAGFADDRTLMYPAFGENEGRLSWQRRLSDGGIPIPTLVHPTAYVSPMADIAPGTVILPHAIVNTGCRIGRGCIVNCGAIIDHDCVLEEGVHVGPGAIVKGENRLPRCIRVQAGQVIPNRTYPL